MTHLKKWIFVVIIISLTSLIAMPILAGAPDTIVTTSADSGEGSLREAILRANSNGRGTIRFAIDAPRPYVITLESALPEITSPVLIDGEAECATETTSSEMGVVIDGTNTDGDGLLLSKDASHSAIRGLAIVGFMTGAGIYVDGADGVVIACNHIGISANGTEAVPNDIGVYVRGEVMGVRIGGDGDESRNVISGNTRYGVWVNDLAIVDIHHNYIGINATGNAAVPNNLSGIYFDATMNGGSARHNVVSGNNEMGILMIESLDVVVTGNFVGTNAAGNAPIPNTLSGVYMRDSQSIQVGDADGRNIISGNLEMGILIRNSDFALVQNNYVGISASGTVAIPNGLSGVGISDGSSDVTIGGEIGVLGNVISGNAQLGIRVSDEGTQDNQILGNLVGTDPTGTYAIPNMLSGVYFREGADNNRMGDGNYAHRNIISGNLQTGLVITNADDIQVAGNYIGTDITGEYSIANAFSGVSIENGSSNNLIGGSEQGMGNLISGNIELGVYVSDIGTSDTVIVGNYIGVDVAGEYAIPNGFSGIGVFNGAADTQVGGLLPTERNIIAGNGQFGVAINGAGARGMVIQNNFIGTDWAGKLAVPNSFGGVVIEMGAREVLVGGDVIEARNVISGNGFSGVVVRNEGTGNVTIIGNFIGSDITGQAPLPNAINGVRLSESADTIFVGTEERGGGNLITFNTSHAVYIDAVGDVSITGNAILNNAGAGVFFANGDAGVRVGRNDFKGNCTNPPTALAREDCMDVVGGGE